MLYFVSLAFAGHYHPSDVAVQSDAFARASETTAEKAGQLQTRARALATALRRFEEGLDLLGDREPAGQRDRLAALEKQYNRDFAVAQQFADDIVGSFDAAFQSALERALKAHPQGASAIRCRAEVPDGPKLPGMRQRTKANPDCTGEALNRALAAAMDRDGVLQAELDAILSRDWPALALPAESVEPVVPDGSDGTAWLDVAEFFRSAKRDALRDIDRMDEEERLAFEVAIEEGASKEALAQLVDDARAVDAKTRQRRSLLAEPVLERAAVVFAKSDPTGAWCAQPALLGGCSGTETPSLADALLDDRKIQRLVR
jgi:hypothetical protein